MIKVWLTLLIGHLEVVFSNILLLCRLTVLLIVDEALYIIILLGEESLLVTVLTDVVKINV